MDFVKRVLLRLSSTRSVTDASAYEEDERNVKARMEDQPDPMLSRTEGGPDPIMGMFFKVLEEIKESHPVVRNVRNLDKIQYNISIGNELRELSDILKRQAVDRTMSLMNISESTFSSSFNKFNESWVNRTYMSAAHAHADGNWRMALAYWVDCFENYKHARSLWNIGCYFIRGLDVVRNDLMARACFKSALTAGLYELNEEAHARDQVQKMSRWNLMSSIGATPSLSHAVMLEELVWHRIRDATIAGKNIRLDKSNLSDRDAVRYSYYLFPNFPNSICEGSDIVGIWEISLKPELNLDEKSRLMRSNIEVNAAKALRQSLGIHERHIYSQETDREALSIRAEERLVKSNRLSGLLLNRSYR